MDLFELFEELEGVAQDIADNSLEYLDGEAREIVEKYDINPGNWGANLHRGSEIVVWAEFSTRSGENNDVFPLEEVEKQFEEELRSHIEGFLGVSPINITMSSKFESDFGFPYIYAYVTIGR